MGCYVVLLCFVCLIVLLKMLRWLKAADNFRDGSMLADTGLPHAVTSVLLYTCNCCVSIYVCGYFFVQSWAWSWLPFTKQASCNSPIIRRNWTDFMIKSLELARYVMTGILWCSCGHTFFLGELCVFGSVAWKLLVNCQPFSLTKHNS